LELGLTDEQRAVFRERRGRWRQLLAESRLRLAPFAADIYEAVPLDEAALFAAGRGRFGGQRCAETQTGDDREEQDSQTDAILVRCCCTQDALTSHAAALSAATIG